MKTAKTNRKTTKATKTVKAFTPDDGAALLAELFTQWQAHSLPMTALAGGFGAAIATDGDKSIIAEEMRKDDATIKAGIAETIAKVDPTPQYDRHLPISYLVTIKDNVDDALDQWIRANAPADIQRLSYILGLLWEHIETGWIFERDAEGLYKIIVEALQILGRMGDWDSDGVYKAAK